jgi:hypothetical protein
MTGIFFAFSGKYILTPLVRDGILTKLSREKRQHAEGIRRQDLEN